MASTNVPTPVIACDLSGATEEQRTRHRTVSAALQRLRQDVKRDGERWTVTFQEDVPLGLIAEFLEFERRCCTFLEYEICGRGLSVCVALGGPRGSAQLIEELFPLVREEGPSR